MECFWCRLRQLIIGVFPYFVYPIYQHWYNTDTGKSHQQNHPYLEDKRFGVRFLVPPKIWLELLKCQSNETTLIPCGAASRFRGGGGGKNFFRNAPGLSHVTPLHINSDNSTHLRPAPERWFPIASPSIVPALPAQTTTSSNRDAASCDRVWLLYYFHIRDNSTIMIKYVNYAQG